ncbi:uncharacterized protein CTHT_0001330 [Thermochaetoides thermophila DSM 1495]|uniref:Hydrophobin n=1 Tax=Chaetomium thermophilum (strain DSM 1495 / CBS 144.50 / IMI 039719) TaxID=759272 RepID=G0RZ13_CHATD|nr:hypothetical protein CTHT_0001330 [Thermochaetoides thermophila DSM 1495]EGS23441.1 hypothetical protein CTHT_0001330 [Thermochaetoides thermophila DSM 1495]
MQFTTIFTVLALAFSAAAAPAPAEKSSGGSTTITSCSNESKPVCCNKSDGLIGVDVLGLTCAVALLGGQCQGTSYCCETDAAEGDGINITALNCVKVA